jgi:hypothetical protein
MSEQTMRSRGKRRLFIGRADANVAAACPGYCLGVTRPPHFRIPVPVPAPSDGTSTAANRSLAVHSLAAGQKNTTHCFSQNLDLLTRRFHPHGLPPREVIGTSARKNHWSATRHPGQISGGVARYSIGSAKNQAVIRLKQPAELRRVR